MEYIADLSPRELQIFILTGQGLTNPEIAEFCFIDVTTVRTHVKRVHSKLYIDGRARLAVAASRVINAYQDN